MASAYPSSSRMAPFLRDYAQRKTPDIDIYNITRSVLLDGTEQVVSHEGTSQYNRVGSGAAACGLAALNFARVVFLKEQDGLRNGALLQAVLSRECAEETTAVCALWSGSFHLEVEDICRVPVFEKTLKLKTTTIGHPGVHHFRSLLTDLTNLDSSAVVIITRPPEILACLKLRLSIINVFIIFDSHPRPSYPNGAGAIVSTSMEGTARRLTELLSVDLQDGVLQWQAQLISNCSGHVFVPRNLESSAAALWQSVLESSLAQLYMQAEISDLRSQNLRLRSQNDFQVSEQKRLETDLKEVDERCQRQERAIQELRSSRSNAHSHHHAPNPQLRSSSSSTSRPPGSNNPFTVPSRHTATSHATSSSRSVTPTPLPLGSNNPFAVPSRHTATSHATSSSRSIGPTSLPLGSNNPFSVPSRHTATSHATSPRSVGPSHDPCGSSPPFFDLDGLYARCMQDIFDSEDRILTRESAVLSRYATSHTTNPRSAGPDDTREGPPAHWDDGFSYALRLQSQFDNEDRELSAERIELSQTIQPVFECGICMEEMPEDSIARPDPCRHAFCRECMRGYVSARLEEHRFPILCPTCIADKGKGKSVTGEVSQNLALNLGLTDEQFNIWSEMEMASLSVLLHCRTCQRSMFVARDDHEEAEIIECPLPDCTNVWCKQCQQTIDPGWPQHSCDGTSELDQLMKQQGWKYCPSCNTPIQKVSGCNHMSCVTPACNTHFCYICGDLIVKSALSQEIEEATSSHYRTECSLFEVPAHTEY